MNYLYQLWVIYGNFVEPGMLTHRKGRHAASLVKEAA